MGRSVELAGVELIVPDLDSALSVLVDAIGLDLIERRSSTDPAGEVAIVAVGDAAITLLQPFDRGPGHVLPKREPRLSQIIFAVDAADVGELAADVAERGLNAQRIDDQRFFVTPAAIEGVFGIPTAIVIAGVDGTSEG